MDIDEAVTLTQDRLAGEGGTMGNLLGHFRNRISPVLIGDSGMGARARMRRETSDRDGRPAIRLRTAAA